MVLIQTGTRANGRTTTAVKFHRLQIAANQKQKIEVKFSQQKLK
jgi:hypothetical protein